MDDPSKAKIAEAWARKNAQNATASVVICSLLCLVILSDFATAIWQNNGSRLNAQNPEVAADG